MNKSNIKYIVVSIVLLIASVSFLKTTLQIMKSNYRLDQLRTEVLDLEKNKSDLRKEVEYQKTDAYIEEEARNKLSLVKENEIVFVVDPELQKELSSGDVLSGGDEFISEDGSVEPSNFGQWLDLLL